MSNIMNNFNIKKRIKLRHGRNATKKPIKKAIRVRQE